MQRFAGKFFYSQFFYHIGTPACRQAGRNIGIHIGLCVYLLLLPNVPMWFNILDQALLSFSSYNNLTVVS